MARFTVTIHNTQKPASNATTLDMFVSIVSGMSVRSARSTILGIHNTAAPSIIVSLVLHPHPHLLPPLVHALFPLLARIEWLWKTLDPLTVSVALPLQDPPLLLRTFTTMTLPSPT